MVVIRVLSAGACVQVRRASELIKSLADCHPFSLIMNVTDNSGMLLTKLPNKLLVPKWYNVN